MMIMMLAVEGIIPTCMIRIIVIRLTCPFVVWKHANAITAESLSFDPYLLKANAHS